MFRPLISQNFIEDPSDGLIKALKQQYPIKDYVFISGGPEFHQGSSASDCLNWGTKWQAAARSSPVYLRYNFHNMGININKYSIKGADSFCYMKTWYLFGESEKNTTYLGNGTSQSICGTENICNSSETEVFSVTNTAQIFTSLLFLSYDTSCLLFNYFSASGLEFFGTIYKKMNVQTINYHTSLGKVFTLILIVFK